MPGPIENKIREVIQREFDPEVLDLTNESDMHSGPPGRESHFKLVLSSIKFEGQSRVARQRSVYAALGSLLRDQVHAFSLYTYTPTEWATLQPDPQSPVCASKAKK